MSLFTRSTKESESNPRSTTMVFPSLPLYLDPPNWSQQQANHHHGSSGVDVSQLPPGAVAAPRLDAAMAGSIRPGSMADRARHAKIPQPEPGLKCPRCDSTNTKFCYFNNYSLSQPRHFCKTCRRYWTRGGALRNVPVGGGCRRNNKRTKSSGGGGSSSMTSATATTCTAATGGGGGGPSSSASSAATSSGVPFVTSLHPLPDFAGSNFPMSFSDTADYNQLGGGGGVDNWRLQQFSLLGALELPPPAPALGFYHFEGSGFAGGLLTGQQSQMLKQSSSGLVTTQLASMKMEDNLHHHQLLNFPRQSSRFNIDQFWNGGGGGGGISGNGWAAADLSRFNSSSSGNLL